MSNQQIRRYQLRQHEEICWLRSKRIGRLADENSVCVDVYYYPNEVSGPEDVGLISNSKFHDYYKLVEDNCECLPWEWAELRDGSPAICMQMRGVEETPTWLARFPSNESRDLALQAPQMRKELQDKDQRILVLEHELNLRTQELKDSLSMFVGVREQKRKRESDI